MMLIFDSSSLSFTTIVRIPLFCNASTISPNTASSSLEIIGLINTSTPFISSLDMSSKLFFMAINSWRYTLVIISTGYFTFSSVLPVSTTLGLVSSSNTLTNVPLFLLIGI